MADIKEKVICPWCKEEMRPYPHQGYYWFQCKCGAKTPTLWHATEEQTRKRALSYTADVVPKSEYDELLKAYSVYEETTGIKKAKKDVAREILDRVDDILWKYKRSGMPVNLSRVHQDIIELKNKYVEEQI